MRRSTALMSIAAVALVASNAFAQAKPNFAGTWNMVVDPAAQQGAGGGGGGGGRRGGGGGGIGFAGQTFTVAQDDASVTITRTQGENTITTKFMLDGSDSKNMMAGRGGNPGMEIISKAKWDGNALVISTTRTMGENTFTTTQKVWIEGDALVIENTAPNRQDPSAAPMVSKVTYKKG